MPARPLSIEELTDRLQAPVAEWSPGASVATVLEMPSGASSLTYLVDFDGAVVDRAVVKVAPPGIAPVRNRDVLRQARLLRSLEGAAGVRVPKVLFEDGGRPPEDPPLFAMGFVEGDSLEPNIDEAAELPPPDVIEGRAIGAATMLGAMHRLDPDQVGLADEASSSLSLGAEVDRWLDLFRSIDDSMVAGFERGAELLHEQKPDEMPPVVLHGDYRLGNMLSRGDQVEAIIDWEIWSIGDPRLDVAWFLLNCDAVDQPTALRRAPGMPSVDVLLRTYERPPTSIQDLEWFGALVRYKSAATMALIVKHNRRRPDPLAHLESFATAVPEYLDYALAGWSRD